MNVTLSSIPDVDELRCSETNHKYFLDKQRKDANLCAKPK